MLEMKRLNYVQMDVYNTMEFFSGGVVEIRSCEAPNFISGRKLSAQCRLLRFENLRVFRLHGKL